METVASTTQVHAAALSDRSRYSVYYSLSGRITVFALLLTAALCTMDRMILTLVVDPIRQDLLISETQMGILQGLSFSLLYAVAGIPLGLMADRLSRTKLLAGAVLVWSGGTFACGLANSFESLFFFRMLVGAGEAALWPVAISLIGDIAPERSRGNLIGGVIIGQLFGGSISLIFGGQLFQAATLGNLDGIPVLGDVDPWRVLFMVYGLAGGLAISLLMLGAEPKRSGTQPQAGSHPLAGLAEFMRFLRKNLKTVGALYLLALFVAVVQYATAAWNIPLLLRRFELGADQVGLIMGLLVFGAGALGSLSGGFFSRKTSGNPLGRFNIIIATYVLCMAYSLVAFNPGLVVTLFLYTLPALLLASAGVMNLVILQEIIPPNLRGVATSVSHLFGSLIGASAGPMIVAILTEHLYKDDAMVGVSLGVVTGPSLAVATLLAIYLRHRLAGKRSSDSQAVPAL